MSSTIAHTVADKILFGSHPFAVPLQRGVQRLLSGPREVTFEFKKGPAAGCQFSCLSSHKYFFVREDYESDLLAPIESMVRRDSIVYDIGAHFGFWAIVLSRLCPTGKIFAFEPSAENRARLVKNVAMNSNVRVVPLAASDRIGASHLSNNGSMAKVGEGSENIETTALDEFCKSNPAPDMLLIDVEGHAGEVLRGASGIFARRFVPIVCEIHSYLEESAVRQFVGNRARINGASGHFPYHAVIS